MKDRKPAFQSILKNVSRYIDLTEEEADYFCGLLRHEKVKGRLKLHSIGQVCHEVYFVIKGCLRAYTEEPGAHEHVLSFAPADYWMSDLYSKISGKEGVLNIETTEPSEILILHRDDQEKLYEKIPKFERFFRILIEKSLVFHQQRLLENLGMSAEKRYARFCEKFPQLVNTLPQKQIASYLGVTPEFFSKLRSKILRQQ